MIAEALRATYHELWNESTSYCLKRPYWFSGTYSLILIYCLSYKVASHTTKLLFNVGYGVLNSWNLERFISIKGYPVQYPYFHPFTYILSLPLTLLKIMSGLKGKMAIVKLKHNRFPNSPLLPTGLFCFKFQNKNINKAKSLQVWGPSCQSQGTLHAQTVPQAVWALKNTWKITLTITNHKTFAD